MPLTPDPAAPELPVNIDDTYPDDPTDPSRRVHQQHHDLIHSRTNPWRGIQPSHVDAEITGAVGTEAAARVAADNQRALLTDPRFSDQRVPADGSVTDAKVDAEGLSQSVITNLVPDLASKATPAEIDSAVDAEAAVRAAADAALQVDVDSKEPAIAPGTYAKPATSGTLAARPAATVIGQRYLATDRDGGTQYESLDGATWTTMTSGITDVHFATATFKHRPWVDPTHRDFAADPTGVTPSGAKIQNAIDVAIALGSGSEMRLGNGTFLIDVPLVWNPGNNKAIPFVGSGYGTVLKASGLAAGAALLSASSGGSNYQELRLSKLRFDLNSLDISAIRTDSLGNMGVLEDLWVGGCVGLTAARGAIELGGALTAAGITVIAFLNRIKIRGSDNPGAGILVAKEAHSLRIANSSVQGCARSIRNSTNLGGDWRIVGNSFETGTTGLELLAIALQGLTIADNRIENFSSRGIELSGFDASNNRQHNVSVRDNFFTSLQAGRVGLRVQRVQGLDIEDNVFIAAVGLGSYPAGDAIEMVSTTTSKAKLRGNTTPAARAVNLAIVNGTSAWPVPSDFTTDQTSKDVTQAFGKLAITGGSGALPSFYGGTGVPVVGLGADGDFYLRADGGTGTAIYHKRAGAWVATAA